MAALGLINGLSGKEARDALRATLKAQKEKEDAQPGAEKELGAVAAAAAASDDAGGDDAAAVFSNYQPKHVKEGKPHPDAVVETATLAAVSPPIPTYKHHLQDAVASGALSNLQIESIIYAFQRFTNKLPDGQRMGFILGDGAGVGKGRQIAGCAYEHWRTGGRRILWVSVNSDLRIDAQRDLADLGLESLPVYPPRDNKTGAVPLGSLDAAGWKHGVLFFTYSLLISSSKSHGTRLKQVIDWLNKDPTGQPLIIFDECHKCKNYVPEPDEGVTAAPAASSSFSFERKTTKTASTAVELQHSIPDARVLYASATGASEPSNLAYMVRLGTFGMPDFKSLLKSLTDSGLGSMELFCMGLKSVGAYACRTLSYSGAEFELATIPLSPAMKTMYDRSCSFWFLLLRVFEAVYANIGEDKKARLRMGQFWGAHQRCFRQLILSAKVPRLAEMAVDATVNKNMAVVIGLQSTGEANTKSATADADGESEFDDWISTPQIVITNLIKTQLPTTRTLAPGEVPFDFRGLYAEIVSITSAWRTMAPVSTNVQDDAEEIELLSEKTLDEVEAEKLERAKREGMFIDLASAPNDDIIAHAEKEAKAKASTAARMADERRKADLERLQKERAAVRAVAGEEAGPEGEAMDVTDGAAPAATGPGRLIGRLVLRGSGRSMEEGTVLRYETETVMSDAPVFVVSFTPGVEEEMTEEELRPLLVAGVADDEDVEPPPRSAVAKGKGKAKAAEAPPPPPKAKPQGGTLVVGGRGLRAGARVARPVVVESSDSDGEDASDSDSSDSDEVVIISDSDAPSLKRKSTSSAELKRGPAKRRVVADSDSDYEADGGSSSDEASEEPIAPAATAGVKSEYAAGPSRAGPSAAPAAVVASGSHKFAHKFVADDDEDDYYSDDDDPFGAPVVKPDPWLIKIKAALLEAAASLELPPCPLDHLIDLCGGVDKVAEMTGRKDRMLREIDGSVRVARRNEDTGVSMKALNLYERNQFQDGKKLISIISEAASTGISLQADRRAGNQRRRLHLTLELSWSADKCIQQFGRSHRSNQVSAPIYRILVTPLGGERRFASSAAKRLLSLGALLRGDRKALGAGQALKEFDVENRWGAEALKRVYEDVCGYSEPMEGVPVPGGDMGAFRANARKALVSCGLATWAGHVFPSQIQNGTQPITISGIGSAGSSKRTRSGGKDVPRFLNRLLGVDVEMQTDLFAYFSATFDARIMVAKTSGSFDDGVVSLKAESLSVTPGFPSRIHTCPISGAETHVMSLELDRGVSFEAALARLRSAEQSWDAAVAAGRARPWDAKGNGFFRMKGQDFLATGRANVMLVTEVWTGIVGDRRARARRCYRILKPNIGHAGPTRWEEDVKDNLEQISEKEAASLWSYWYKFYSTHCSHGENCSRKKDGIHCQQGTRKSKERLVIGACLPVWGLVCDCVKVASKHDEEKLETMRVVRCKTDDDRVFVGLHLSSEHKMNTLIGAVEAMDVGADAFKEEDEF